MVVLEVPAEAAECSSPVAFSAMSIASLSDFPDAVYDTGEGRELVPTEVSESLEMGLA